MCTIKVGTEAQNYAVGIEIAPNAGEVPPTCTKAGAECAADCSTLMVNFNTFNIIAHK